MGEDTKKIDVIGRSDEAPLRSESDLSYRERLYDASDDSTEIGHAVGTFTQSGDRAAGTVVLSLNGMAGYRRGQVIARGNLPVVDGELASGTLAIIAGNAYDRRHGGTLIVEIWNPKKYSQSDP
jgi:glutamate synthase domain-containing protein 3